MIRKLFCLAIIALTLVSNTHGQATTDNGTYSNVHSINQLPPAQQKSMLTSAARVYEVFHNIVTNAQNNSVSPSLINDFCEKGFWPGAKVELKSPITRKSVLMDPCPYLHWLYGLYHGGKYDNTSIINMDVLLTPRIEPDTNNTYKVVYDVSQTMINKKNNNFVKEDSTIKSITIQFRFDSGNHPRIAGVKALHAYSINPKQ